MVPRSLSTTGSTRSPRGAGMSGCATARGHRNGGEKIDSVGNNFFMGKQFDHSSFFQIHPWAASIVLDAIPREPCHLSARLSSRTRYSSACSVLFQRNQPTSDRNTQKSILERKRQVKQEIKQEIRKGWHEGERVLACPRHPGLGSAFWPCNPTEYRERRRPTCDVLSGGAPAAHPCARRTSDIPVWGCTSGRPDA